MREHRTWLFFLIRRGWLSVQGLIRFGPVRTQRWGKSVRTAFDAFEHHYGRLPDNNERSRLVQKLFWFDQFLLVVVRSCCVQQDRCLRNALF